MEILILREYELPFPGGSRVLGQGYIPSISMGMLDFQINIKSLDQMDFVLSGRNSLRQS